MERGRALHIAVDFFYWACGFISARGTYKIANQNSINFTHTTDSPHSEKINF